MKTKIVWCLKVNIVINDETISDYVRLFKNVNDAKEIFNDIVECERKYANDDNFTIESNNEFNFEAYEYGCYASNHSSINLFEIEIE